MSSIRIGDDAALLALVPVASVMRTAKGERLLLAAYRIRGMLSFENVNLIWDRFVTLTRDRPWCVVVVCCGRASRDF